MTDKPTWSHNPALVGVITRLKWLLWHAQTYTVSTARFSYEHYDEFDVQSFAIAASSCRWRQRRLVYSIRPTSETKMQASAMVCPIINRRPVATVCFRSRIIASLCCCCCGCWSGRSDKADCRRLDTAAGNGATPAAAACPPVQYRRHHRHHHHHHQHHRFLHHRQQNTHFIHHTSCVIHTWDVQRTIASPQRIQTSLNDKRLHRTRTNHAYCNDCTFK